MDATSSMNTALTLLRGKPMTGMSMGPVPSQVSEGGAEITSKSSDTSSPPIGTRAKEIMREAHKGFELADKGVVEDFVALQNELAAGTLSPLSERAGKYDGGGIRSPFPADSRMMDEGTFGFSSASAAETPEGQAKFADRQVGMLNAYHYGAELADNAQALATLTNSAANHQDRLDTMKASIAKGGPEGEAAQAYMDHLQEQGGRDYGRKIASARDGVDDAKAMLKTQFGFTAEVVQKDADGQSAFQGFEISHEKLGRVMSVDAEGEITLYDAQGKGYSGETYNAANADAFIPELHNDEVRRADSEAPREERNARAMERLSQLQDWSERVDMRR